MSHIRNLLLCFLFLVINPVYAQDSPDILQIYDQFVTSSAAASRCIKPDKETLNHFLANFQMVSIYASQELIKRYPERTKEQIASAMKNRNDAITQKIFELVREKGCDNPNIQQVVKRFFVQAKWQPGK
ncbi:MAG: hypothetical protein HZB79_06125 [Deltaproteobacteria bacterium]|nr:hypothetical protein [Deltaproteobacteria bacterium]